MGLMKSKEQFVKDYQIFVLETLSILKRFPECVFFCVDQEKMIKNAPDDFREKTFILLESLAGFYSKIDLLPNDSVIEGLTKKLLISYSDKVKGYHGLKAGGRYTVTISLNGFKQAYSNLLPDVLTVKRPYKKGSDASADKSIHPHVRANSTVCWSEMQKIIEIFLKKAQFLEVLLCTCQFLRHANLESCYIKDEFLAWEEVKPAKKITPPDLSNPFPADSSNPPSPETPS